MVPWLQWLSLGFFGDQGGCRLGQCGLSVLHRDSSKERTVGTIVGIPGLFMCSLVLIKY